MKAAEDFITAGKKRGLHVGSSACRTHFLKLPLIIIIVKMLSISQYIQLCRELAPWLLATNLWVKCLDPQHSAPHRGKALWARAPSLVLTFGNNEGQVFHQTTEFSKGKQNSSFVHNVAQQSWGLLWMPGTAICSSQFFHVLFPPRNSTLHYFQTTPICSAAIYLRQGDKAGRIHP